MYNSLNTYVIAPVGVAVLYAVASWQHAHTRVLYSIGVPWISMQR